MRKQPELIETVKRVEDCREQEAEAKREVQARQDRYQGVLDRIISEGHEQLQVFSQSSRIDFYEKETKAIYYGIMATATKSNIALCSPQGAKFAVERFLASMEWNGCGNYRRECVAHWTKLFATDEVVYTEPIIQNFLSFIDYMSCSADTYVSLGGSNGCADQLTNWDGTQKFGLGAPPKRSHKVYPDNDNERRFVALITTNRLKLQKCDARIKISNDLFFRLNKILYLCSQ